MCVFIHGAWHCLAHAMYEYTHIYTVNVYIHIRFCYVHFKDEETEAQRGLGTKLLSGRARKAPGVAEWKDGSRWVPHFHTISEPPTSGLQWEG